MQDFLDNFPEYTVSEISSAIKQNLENSFGYVKIKGEISGLKRHVSGHYYFNLKDDNAVINAVCFRNVVSKLQIPPEEGQEVIIFGNITSYPGRSNYQIIVNNVSLAGLGSLMALLEKRKKEFAQKGYFAEEHKKPLKRFPEKIAVITSESGAVIKDICHRIEERFPLPILLAHAKVQGKGAEIEIAKQIEFLNSLEVSKKPDVIIIARGGGSIEDLWCFNEEILILAAFHSEIPIISAIGHETDTSLLDLVADLRAPTPTAAAEFATPDGKELRKLIEKQHLRLTSAIKRQISEKENLAHQLGKFFRSPERIIQEKTQRIDELFFRLEQNLQMQLIRKRQHLSSLANKISTSFMLSKLQNYQDLLTNYSRSLHKNLVSFFEKEENKVNHLEKLLNSLSYKNILRRGFILLKDKQGNIISSKNNIPNGDASLEFFDGKEEVVISKKVEV